ncbi:hypothetical protein RUM43_005746 [Polyplax serrata]|uniref:Uncharacterized protein n=1 Tax=Polyplax serrata TaxID=468196 RepID=A0AAN8S1P6_POLSC
MIKEEQTIEWKDIGDEEDDDEDAGKGDVKPEVTPVKKSTGNQISLSCWDYSIELEYLKDPEELAPLDRSYLLSAATLWGRRLFESGGVEWSILTLVFLPSERTDKSETNFRYPAGAFVRGMVKREMEKQVQYLRTNYIVRMHLSMGQFPTPFNRNWFNGFSGRLTNCLKFSGPLFWAGR